MPLYGEEKRRYQREWRAKRRAEFFSGKHCAVCGSIEDLELDHIDRSTKISNRIWSWSEPRRLAEIEKCQVLCAIHHKEKTRAENLKSVTHGDYSRGYSRGCRCEACTECVAPHWRAYRAARASLESPGEFTLAKHRALNSANGDRHPDLEPRRIRLVA